MNEQAWLAVMSGANPSFGAQLARVGLACLAPVYGCGAALKNKLFDWGLAKAHDLGRPVVSIGNLTTGGTGKTPMVAFVVRRLAAAGHRPCVLLRGYRAKNGVSDEAEELRLLVGDVAQVAPNPDRVAEAGRQLALHPEITCFVLDDGFQHRRAKRNLDVVLVDATNPWGYGFTLPRGLLRESRRNLRRADVVVVTRADRVGADKLAQVEAQVRDAAGGVPLLTACHAWDGYRIWHDGVESVQATSALSRSQVGAVCGIGNPEAFLAQARALAQNVVWARACADHFAWNDALLGDVFAQAQAAGAAVLLTTEKDFVKWLPLLGALRPPLPVWRPRLSMQFPQGHEALSTLLTSKIPLVSCPPPTP